MAVSVRVLVHDTKRSHSLLKQLDQKDSKLLDTAWKYSSNNLLSYSGLIATSIGAEGIQHVALLDTAPNSRWVSFDEWWNQVVFAKHGEESLLRKDIVLGLANQDGGAHVDPELDEKFAKVSRLNALQHYEGREGGVEVPMRQPELAAMRQIAHEVLKTLRPNYEKKSSTPPLPTRASGEGGGSSYFSIRSVSFDTSPRGLTPYQHPVKVGRNAPCPCNSGRKHKHCCGKR